MNAVDRSPEFEASGRSLVTDRPRRQPEVANDVSTWQAGSVYRELNSRDTAGVTIEWHLAEDGSHLVVVLDPSKKPVAVFKDLDGVEARERYDHPFASKSTPDVF
jgi:hypothetical protein